MIAPLGTLVFLGLLWLLTVGGAAVVEGNGAKIMAALKGRSRPAPNIAQMRIRVRAGAPASTRAMPPLRAAA